MTRPVVTFAATVAAVTILLLTTLSSMTPATRSKVEAGTLDRLDRPGLASTNPVSAVAPTSGPRDLWSRGISSVPVAQGRVQAAYPKVYSSPAQTPTAISPSDGSAVTVTPPKPANTRAVVIPTPSPPVPSLSRPAPKFSTGNVTLGSAVPPEIRRWEPAIIRSARASGIDPNLIAAIMETESQGSPDAVSLRGAVGLMQVIDGPTQPDANIDLGVKILAFHLNHYAGDLQLSLAAYNAGSGAVSQFGGLPPYLETENYVFLVLNRYYRYQSS